ncbi:MAG TPA: AAA family ATPase [Rubricoccaceae bacterium]
MNGRETVRAVSVGTLPEPPPREWRVAGLVPEGAPSILAGHSGLGKSYVALCLALCVCTGRPFLGRDVRSASVLWVDRELDQEETARRAYAVARGMGLDRPPDNLFYLRPLAAIGTDEAQAVVLADIEEHAVGLTILDSLTLGAVGDAKEQRDVVPVMRTVEAWGTSLCIDHITKAAAAGNQSSASIFGSGMKRAMARSTFNLVPAGDALTLHPDKSNFGPASTPVHFLARHGADEAGRPEVVFEKVEVGHESLDGAGEHAPAHEQTFLALARLYAEAGAPVHLSALMADRDLRRGTVRNRLSALKGRVVKHGDNTYSLELPVVTASEGTGTPPSPDRSPP